MLFCSSVDIPLSEGPVNLNWGPIMKTINESPHDFFKEGGWSFLGGGGGGEGVSPNPRGGYRIFSHQHRAMQTMPPLLSPSLRLLKMTLLQRKAVMEMPVITRLPAAMILMNSLVGVLKTAKVCKVLLNTIQRLIQAIR